MVEPTVRLVTDRTKILHECTDVGGEFGRAGRGVLLLVEALREAVEVVEQRHRGGGTDGERCGFPVCAHDEDRLRAGEVLGPRTELAGPDRIVEQDRCTVADVQSWHTHSGTVAGDSSKFN